MNPFRRRLERGCETHVDRLHQGSLPIETNNDSNRGPAIDALVAAKPYFTKGKIASGQYGSSADVPSFGVTAILMTTASMDSRVVAEFAKSLASQIDTLRKRHPVLEGLNAQAMPLDKLPAPLHPAAAQANGELGPAK